MKSLMLLLQLFLGFILIAQNQNNNWKFGHNGAGLNFEECSTTILTDGISNLLPFEGQSSISDSLTGELLLYTDGYNIYDASNNIMLNGDAAGLSNTMTQNIIIKKPGSNNIFYVFTPDVQCGTIQNINYPNAFGLNYAVVDMSLNNGLGQVVSKFNPLKDTCNCEKLTAVYHSNGHDIWLIGHEYRNNKFFAYLITSSGISTTPVFSSVGPIHLTWQIGIEGNSNFDAIGELKASPDGTKLAYTTYYNGITGIVDFDRSSGIISNSIELQIPAGGYGVSFSPNGLMLYITGVDTSHSSMQYPTNGSIYQFDISSSDLTTIQNSFTTIYNDPNGAFRSLKLSPKGELIVSRGNGTNYLGLIESPNNPGASCNYIHDGVHLNGLEGRWGLNNTIEDSIFCEKTNDLIISIENSDEVFIYPNPFVDDFEIKNLTYPSVVSVYSLEGTLVRRYQVESKYFHSFGEDLSSGSYILQISNADQVYVYRVSKI